MRDGGSSGLDRAALNSANMRRLRGEKLPPPSMADPGLAAVICRACDPDPEKRYQTADSFRLDLQRCLDPGVGEKPFVSFETPAPGKNRGNALGKAMGNASGKNRGNAPGKPAGWLLPAVVAVLAVLLVVAGVFLAGSSSGKKASSRPQQRYSILERLFLSFATASIFSEQSMPTICSAP